MKYVISILICLIAFTLQGLQIFMPHDPISPSEQAVNKLMSQIAQTLEENYHMHPVGVAVAMPGGVVKRLGLDFQIKGPLSKEEIRRILINSAQDFLALVNKDEDVKPYLENNPCEIKNLDINFFIIGNNGRRVDDPDIGIAGIRNGKLNYWTLVTTDIPHIKTKAIESYKEALQALQNSP